MANVAASANDPIFLNHHAMVDCIFEEWLQKNPSAQYPVSNEIRKGHRSHDYIVPFFPLYTHRDMFHTAEKFGYQCKSGSIPCWAKVVLTLESILFVVCVCIIIIYSYKCHKARRDQNKMGGADSDKTSTASNNIPLEQSS
jgi:tyrosinase